MRSRVLQFYLYGFHYEFLSKHISDCNEKPLLLRGCVRFCAACIFTVWPLRKWYLDKMQCNFFAHTSTAASAVCQSRRTAEEKRKSRTVSNTRSSDIIVHLRNMIRYVEALTNSSISSTRHHRAMRIGITFALCQSAKSRRIAACVRRL